MTPTLPSPTWRQRPPCWTPPPASTPWWCRPHRRCSTPSRATPNGPDWPAAWKTPTARLAVLQAAQDSDREPLERLGRLLERCPAGHLDTLDRRGDDQQARAAAAHAVLEGLAGEQAGISAWLAELPARRNALDEQRQALIRSIGILEPLAEASATRETLEQQREAAVVRAQTATVKGEQAGRPGTSGRRAAAATAHDQANAFAHQVQDFTDRHAEERPPRSAPPGSRHRGACDHREGLGRSRHRALPAVSDV